jgi:hypothetical protein
MLNIQHLGKNHLLRHCTQCASTSTRRFFSIKITSNSNKSVFTIPPFQNANDTPLDKTSVTDLDDSMFSLKLYRLRITGQLFKTYVLHEWCVHNRLFNAHYEVKFKKTPNI